MLPGAFENLLINGDFALWSRLAQPAEGVECAAWRRTFAADRWGVRYARAAGEAVRQSMSADVPEGCPAPASLEIRGAKGVKEMVRLGQRIEAAEASRYRQRLIFSAWIFAEYRAEIDVVLSSPRYADVFDETIEANREFVSLPANQWTRIEREIDARRFSANGLSMELEIPADFLQRSGAMIRVTGARLAVASQEAARPLEMERFLARRYFQRHDETTINSPGRAIVVNNHELHFQFAFPEMRSFPACTVPRHDGDLRVFNFEGVPQSGFAFDVTRRSRGSVIIRATKTNHGVRDGYLLFAGDDAAILLDAEL
jgi:hypothetical protein